METDNRCSPCARRAVWICFLGCLFLFFFKAVVGFMCGSKAMLGSALYSFTDLVSSFLLLISFKASMKPADSDHPYGHGKIEHIVSLIIGFIIISGTLFLVWNSTMSLYQIELTPPHWIGIWASFASLSLSTIVGRLVSCAALRNNSPSMKAQAKHLGLDGLSDVAVIVAIGAAELGFRMLDPVVALVESVHILYESFKMLAKALKHLMDTKMDHDCIEKAQALISQQPGVKGVSWVNGKSVGQGIALDVGIFLDRSLTISGCDAISANVKKALRAKVPHVHVISLRYLPHTEAEASD